MSVQRIVEDAPPIDLQAEAQHATGEVEEPVRDNLIHVIFFVNLCKSQPRAVFSICTKKT